MLIDSAVKLAKWISNTLSFSEETGQAVQIWTLQSRGTLLALGLHRALDCEGEYNFLVEPWHYLAGIFSFFSADNGVMKLNNLSSTKEALVSGGAGPRLKNSPTPE